MNITRSLDCGAMAAGHEWPFPEELVKHLSIPFRPVFQSILRSRTHRHFCFNFGTIGQCVSGLFTRVVHSGDR